MTFFRYKALIELEEKQLLVKGDGIISAGKLNDFITEIFILLLFPNPFLNGINFLIGFIIL